MITGSQIGRGGAPIGPPSSPEPNHNQPHDENDEDDYCVDYHCQGGVLSICLIEQSTICTRGRKWGSLRTFLRCAKNLKGLNTYPLQGFENCCNNKFQC